MYAIRSYYDREARKAEHVGRLVMHHEACVPDQPALARELLIAEGKAEIRNRVIGAQGPAHLHRLDRAPRGRAAADLHHDLAQRNAEAGLEKPAEFHIARNLQRDRAARAAHADIMIGLRAMSYNFV